MMSGEDPNAVMNFCSELSHHARLKSTRRFYCGSTVDILEHQTLAKIFDDSNFKMDIDQVQYKCIRFAFSPHHQIPDIFSGDIFMITSEELPTGYVKLYNAKTQRNFRWFDIPETNKAEVRTGPAVSQKHRTFLLNPQSPLSNPEADGKEADRYPIPDSETTYAVHSPYWPEDAFEWTERERLHNFPSKSVMKKCLRYGCDFVKKSRVKNDYTEWRYSFSRAEVFIARSWTTPQRIVYDTLWVINKKIQISAGSPCTPSLCTYYFKTLMFWASEEKPAEFWNSGIQAVSKLIEEMITCLELKCCPNYFIPTNNMLNEFTDADIKRDVHHLRNYLKPQKNIANELEDTATCDIDEMIKQIDRQLYETIPKIIEDCKRCEEKAGRRMFDFILPSWIKRAFVIYYRLDNPFDTFSKTKLSTEAEYRDALREELSDIYRGLLAQKHAVACLDLNDKENYLKSSERNLNLAANLCKSPVRVTLEDCPVEFVKLICMKFMVNVDNKHSTNSRKIDMQLLEYSITSGEDQFEDPYYSCTSVHLYKEWPIRSPTVNTSWFIAKAYLANLFYMKGNLISLAKVCYTIHRFYKLSRFNQRLAERTFPVVLSTDFISIYDREIQQLLGFYSLCSHAFNLPSRSVYLGVCPIQFSLYLRVRGTERNILSINKIMIDQYFKHQETEYSIKHEDTEYRKPKVTGYKTNEETEYKHYLDQLYPENNEAQTENRIRREIDSRKHSNCECDDKVNNGLVLLNAIVNKRNTLAML